MQFVCPCCGKDITDAVKEILRKNCSAAGSAKTARKTAAQKKNMAKLNAAYTPEKRAAAAQKRLATLARKKQQQ